MRRRDLGPGQKVHAGCQVAAWLDGFSSVGLALVPVRILGCRHRYAGGFVCMGEGGKSDKGPTSAEDF